MLFVRDKIRNYITDLRKILHIDCNLVQLHRYYSFYLSKWPYTIGGAVVKLLATVKGRSRNARPAIIYTQIQLPCVNVRKTRKVLVIY